MAFSASSLRWPDSLDERLPASLQQGPYLVLVPATLLALVLAYTLTKSSQRLEAAVPAQPAKRSLNKSPTVLLVGLPESGKTSLFSSLVYRTVPDSLPSQVESQGQVPLDGLKPATLVDLPGHARLLPKVDQHISQADGLVICIDTLSATKSSADGITQIADLVHSTLTSLAKTRQRTGAAPPSVLLLFTRSDLSPLAARREQLLTRCRTALENELSRRRDNMGLGSKRPAGVRIAGVGKVTQDPSAPAAGPLGWLKRLFSSSTSSAKEADDEEEEEDSNTAADYVGWGETTFNFDQLDEEVVHAGRVDFALASVGTERGWAHTSSAPGTQEVTRWLGDLQVVV